MIKLAWLIPVLFCTLASSGQTALRFCVQVDSTGKCAKPSTEFHVSDQGGTISFLLSNKQGLNAEKVRCKVYFLDESGNEKLTTSLDQNIRKDWTYSWLDVIFYNPGTYKVKVYAIDDKETFMCSEILKIFAP
jgi:hypothetical protein